MKFEKIESKIAVLPIDNIDTDQIIPARYLKSISKDGLGEGLFRDWRYNADGTPKADFVLNKPEAKGVEILVTGDNFGCGSSREHAPWALVQIRNSRGDQHVVRGYFQRQCAQERACCRWWFPPMLMPSC